jgi:amino acid transporter
MAEGISWQGIKQAIVGKPIASHLAHHERLSKTTGLAILSSDAMSSVAYATEEVLRVLVTAGAVALLTPISFTIAALLVIVAFSYRYTIFAYPQGGGAFIVAKDNLGINAGLVAGASIMIDYVLTVAVSVAAGVSALVSAFPTIGEHRVLVAMLLLIVLMVGNLRGIKESGRIFAVPTYFFLASMMTLIAVGFWKVLTGNVTPVVGTEPFFTETTLPVTVFLVLRAFANGCTAMTGIEAVADGVPAFRPPEPKNAATTLLIMATLCVTLFCGVSVLAGAYQVLPQQHETVVSMIARGVFEGRNALYYCVQIATMLILVLAANTAYSDFPRLASVLARERFLARQLLNQGDRLAFSNGILLLTGFAAVLIIAFQGDTHALIPLYMLGVFVSFTLSQAGMVKRRLRERSEGWLVAVLINGVGATLTGTVLVIVAVTKFHEGAWIIMLLIPSAVLLFKAIHRHYRLVGVQLSLDGWSPNNYRHHAVLIPIGGLHRAVVEAVEYARHISSDVRAVYVDLDPRATAQLREEWQLYGQGAQLVVLDSPYRSLMEPLLEYIEQVEKERPDDFVTIVMPEFVPARWWHHLLHNQRALLIRTALHFRRNTVVTSVPFHLRR